MTRPNVLPSAICTASAPRIGIFRGSMAGLCAPLSTLRRNPRGQLRMTRGRCGSLLLHRKRLALSTPCRSPGASQMSSGLPLKADIAQSRAPWSAGQPSVQGQRSWPHIHGAVRPRRPPRRARRPRSLHPIAGRGCAKCHAVGSRRFDGIIPQSLWSLICVWLDRRTGKEML
jgi:hypothetical protein